MPVLLVCTANVESDAGLLCLQDRGRLASNSLASTSGAQIIHGKPFTRRNSTFQVGSPHTSTNRFVVPAALLVCDVQLGRYANRQLRQRILTRHWSAGTVVSYHSIDRQGNEVIWIISLTVHGPSCIHWAT